MTTGAWLQYEGSKGETKGRGKWRQNQARGAGIRNERPIPAEAGGWWGWAKLRWTAYHSGIVGGERVLHIDIEVILQWMIPMGFK